MGERVWGEEVSDPLAWHLLTVPARRAAITPWAEKQYSAGEIAAEIPGASRSAIIGFCRRADIKLHGRQGMRHGMPKPVTIRVQSKPAKVRAVREAVVRSVEIAEPVVTRDGLIPLDALTSDMCRWPLGDPRREGFGFCGAHVAQGSYCEEHAGMAYRRVGE